MWRRDVVSEWFARHLWLLQLLTYCGRKRQPSMMMCSGVPDVVELVLVLVLQCVQLTPSNNINITSHKRCMTTSTLEDMIMCIRMCILH